MTESLSELLTSLIRDARVVREGPRDNWYPSDMGSCDRKSVLKHAGLSGNPIDDATIRVFWMGDVYHQAIQRAVGERLPGRVWHEVEVKDETYHVSGRLDTLRYSPEEPWDDAFELFEYKTARATAFQHQLPKPENVLQVAVGLTFPPTCPECLGYESIGKTVTPYAGDEFCGGIGVLPIPTHGRLIYVSKEDGRMEEFVIARSAVLSEKVLEVLSRLQGYYEEYQLTGKLPPPLTKVPLMVKGQVVRYSKSGAWGKAGDPKMTEDWRVRYCDFLGTGLCCGDAGGATHHMKGTPDEQGTGEDGTPEGS